MITQELEAISIFSKDLGLDLTINQISKKLNKSYAYTNKFIRDLLDTGILSKKIVGSAILCSLNFSNEKTLGLLMLNSIDDKTNFLKKTDDKIKDQITKLSYTPSLKAIFTNNNHFTIICEDKEKANQYINNLGLSEIKINIIEQNEFKLSLRALDLKEITILEGYETFWKLIASML